MERRDYKMAALGMGKANTSANLSVIFNAKAEQAKLAQARGDRTTFNKLRKELLELNLQILKNTKWMMEQVAQNQTPVVTGKQEYLRSTQIQTSEKEIGEFGEQKDILIAQLQSLQDMLAKRGEKIKYIQPYVEDDKEEEQSITRQDERRASGRREELKAHDESDKGDKGFNCEISGAQGDLNTSDSTNTHKIPGLPTSDDLDRLVYDAGERRKPEPKPRVKGYGGTTFHPKTSGKLVGRANVVHLWLCLEGFEKHTSQWLELAVNGRRRTATTEKDEMEERESQRTCFEGTTSTPQHSCSCGETCSLVEKATIQKRLYQEKSLLEEENARYRDKQFQKEREFLTRKILATLRKLEDDVYDSVEIKL